ncbi:hypothetical protein CDL15_Pgr014358 [Punica granatum]|uniref:Uncharacterized protein n=1 Tax=Punica granatum TaxID=22663 RepID=A0A218WCZ9_PUNGR|nr:hypothetical protein CDL15_Pgr014358 [Punica granatum]
MLRICNLSKLKNLSPVIRTGTCFNGPYTFALETISFNPAYSNGACFYENHPEIPEHTSLIPYPELLNSQSSFTLDSDSKADHCRYNGRCPRPSYFFSSFVLSF